MARYINADDLIKKIFPFGMVDNGNYTINAKAVKVAIESTQTEDVVEVVRCKNCAYWESGSGCTTGRCESPRNGLFYEYTDEFDFCSYGKPKEDCSTCKYFVGCEDVRGGVTKCEVYTRE